MSIVSLTLFALDIPSSLYKFPNTQQNMQEQIPFLKKPNYSKKLIHSPVTNPSLINLQKPMPCKDPLQHERLRILNCKVYVCEHLSPDCKYLHAATRLKAKELKFKYVWVKYGRVYMRKDDRAGHILVKNVDFLNNITLNGIISRHTPLSTGNSCNYPTWFSPVLRQVLREKLKYHRLFKKYGNPRDYDTFSLLRSRCKKLIAEDYYVFVSSVESSLEHDIKNFWRFVNSKKDTNAIPQTMTYGNLVSSDQRGICELFSRYFGSVFDSSGVTADGLECRQAGMKNIHHTSLSVPERLVNSTSLCGNCVTMFESKSLGRGTQTLHPARDASCVYRSSQQQTDIIKQYEECLMDGHSVSSPIDTDLNAQLKTDKGPLTWSDNNQSEARLDK
ncbi:hypothetical protein HW555_007590 [Spodoptera exigua]|uniref:FP protein C-terminal domain-containing protein n=1 Tax=Spodoptera exigua TaxID=7107 RepID=A0A835L490_SPOEX|nr:hypothetical protein HW555_007590 [Spodoptera exigua]